MSDEVRNPERAYFYTGSRRDQNIVNVHSHALGLIEGSLADGVLCDNEIMCLYEWLKEACGANRLEQLMELRQLIAESLEDGHIDADERAAIHIFLARILSRSDGPKKHDEEHSNFLAGLIKGVIANGKLVEDEAAVVADFVESSDSVQNNLVNRGLIKILNDSFLDGYMSERELEVLQDSMTARVGDSFHETGDSKTRTPKAALVNEGVPTAVMGCRVCCTGKLEGGYTRADFKEVVIQCGGTNGGFSRKVDYLAIAGYADARYKHGDHGNKIADVLEYNANGGNIKIVDADELYSAMIAQLSANP